MSAIDNDAAQGWVAIKRRSDAHRHPAELMGQLFDNAGQVSLQMNSQSQEIGDHQNLRSALTGQLGNGIAQRGGNFKKRRFTKSEPTGLRCFQGYPRNSGIRGRNAGAVSEDDDSCVHATP